MVHQGCGIATYSSVIGCTVMSSFLGIHTVSVAESRGCLLPVVLQRDVVGGVGTDMFSGVH